MSDSVLDAYITNLLEINIEEGKFEQHIDMFSKFLGYVNADYKYNGTYLSQYVTDFMQVYKALKVKNEKYNEIFAELLKIGICFELVIDHTYYGKLSAIDVIEKRYIEIDRSKITSNSVEVRIIIEHREGEYLFCKEYQDLEMQLSKRVCKDVKAFMRVKRIRGIGHDII